MQHPVILLIDNDDGAQSIYNALKAVTKATAKPDGNAPFYPVTHNLYIVPTPLNGNPKTMIEDCFDASVKNTKVDGKSFNPSSDALDGKTKYGKYVFAEQVVKKNQGNINFQGFKRLLERIDAVLIRHNNINIVSGALHAPS